MKLLTFLFGLVMLFLAGCGGGGTSAPSTFELTGIVEVIGTGGAPSPVASVQVGPASANTNVDGSFTLQASPGASFALVVFTPTGGSPVTFRFDFPTLTADRDLGTLFVGPEQITVTGIVRNQDDSSAVSGATVTLAGKTTTTDGSGSYTFVGLAYDSGQPFTFLNLTGRAGKAGFFPRVFFPDSGPVSGLANLADVFLQPDSGDAPPGTPFNIEGFVNPAGTGVGATVELYSEPTLVRSVTTGADRKFGFWVAPGNYTILATKGTLTSGSVPVSLSGPADTVRRDVTLN